MANLIRCPKSGNEWTQHDLQAYNIRVVFQDATTFFGGPLPQPTVHPDILTVQSQCDVTKDDVACTFMASLEEATSGVSRHIQTFIWYLFKHLRYEEGVDGVVMLRADIQSIICGQVRHVKVDAEILSIEGQRHLLLMQEDKRRYPDLGPELDPEPQLIAAAIAAFSKANAFHVQALGLPPPEKQMIPGITMLGSMPTFYKIPVTTSLAIAVEDGCYPAQETVVYAHFPVLPTLEQEGMVPLDNRHVLLSCFEAFRQFLP